MLERLPLGHGVLPPLVDDRYVWIIAMGERNLTRIDQRSGEAVDAPHGPLPLSLAAGAGSLWLRDESGQVRRIDPETLKVTAKIYVGGRLRRTGFGGGMAWITTESRLMAIDRQGGVPTGRPRTRGAASRRGRFLRAGWTEVVERPRPEGLHVTASPRTV